MKIQNNTKTTYTHGDLKLLPNGEITEVKDEKIAKVWLSIDGIIEYIAPADVKVEKAALEAEIKKLKAEIKALKEGKKEDKDEDKESVSLDDLKKEADELGISYAKNIGAEKLQDKINAFKEGK